MTRIIPRAKTMANLGLVKFANACPFLVGHPHLALPVNHITFRPRHFPYSSSAEYHYAGGNLDYCRRMIALA